MYGHPGECAPTAAGTAGGVRSTWLSVLRSARGSAGGGGAVQSQGLTDPPKGFPLPDVGISLLRQHEAQSLAGTGTLRTWGAHPPRNRLQTKGGKSTSDSAENLLAVEPGPWKHKVLDLSTR